MGTLSNSDGVPGPKRSFADGRDPLLEALPVAAAILNPDGTIRSANRLWRDSSPDASPGANYLLLHERQDNPHASAQAAAGVRAVLAGGIPEFHCDLAAGFGPEPASVRLTAVPYGDGASGCALLLRQSAALDEDRQLRSRRLETVGRMAGGVAHDFANLLTLIAGNSEMLLDRVGERDPLRADLEEIRKAAGRGSRLTAQLLDFARGRAPEPRLLDLNALIASMEAMLRPIADGRIEMETRLAADLGQVVADAGQLEQVVLNLVLNARDAMPEGGRVVIETSNREVGEEEARERGWRPGPAVQLSVSDTGRGMSAATLARIFEPFFTTRETGTGLGLDTVRQIVGRSLGQVWADSLPGQGATITVRLPRAPRGCEAPAAAIERRPAGAVGGGETILVVEDHDGVRKLVLHLLAALGYRVFDAPSAEAALRIFGERAGEIDLLLTDLDLPAMNGRELARCALEIEPSLQVVYMSGHTDGVLLPTGAFGPRMSLLRKPLRPDELASRVRQALDARPRTSSRAG